MESPTPEGKLNKSGGINLTAIVIAIVICAAGLGALLILKDKPAAGNTAASSSTPHKSDYAPKPDVPAFITWRETKLTGQTQVARIWAKGDGQLPLRVLIQIESAVSGERKSKEIVLERSHTEEPFEIGFLEGHEFVPGDKISVVHKDYSPVTSTCKSLK